MRFLKFFVRDCVECKRPIENGRGSIRCLDCREITDETRAVVVMRLVRETRKNHGGDMSFSYLRNLMNAIATYSDPMDQEALICREILRRLDWTDETLADVVIKYANFCRD